MEPVWLVSQGRVLAAADLAVTRTDRRRGLAGSPRVEAPLVIPSCNWVHTFGMRVPLDVAFLDAAGTVLEIRPARPGRLGRRCSRASSVIEASSGSFERWGLAAGDTVEIRHTGPGAS